jgi:Protein of unknown function (DUF3179)
MTRMRRRLAFELSGLMLVAAGIALAFQTKPSLPYKAIENPEFIPANQATFMSDRDRLIGVSDGKIAKAYPAGILAQHGLVQDKLSDGPIAVTW